MTHPSIVLLSLIPEYLKLIAFLPHQHHSIERIKMKITLVLLVSILIFAMINRTTSNLAPTSASPHLGPSKAEETCQEYCEKSGKRGTCRPAYDDDLLCPGGGRCRCYEAQLTRKETCVEFCQKRGMRGACKLGYFDDPLCGGSRVCQCFNL